MENNQIIVSSCKNIFSLKREVVFVESVGKTIAELMEDSGVYLGDCLNAYVFLNGEPVPREQWQAIIPKTSDILNIRVIPMGGGDGGKDPLRAISSIIVIAASAGIGAFVAGTGTFFGMAGLGMGTGWGAAASAVVGTVGMLAVNAIAPPATPQLDRIGPASSNVKSASLGGTSSDARSSPSISGGNNPFSQYGVIPVVLGTCRVTPPHGALPYTELVGNDQYLRQLFVIGHGNLDIFDMRLGETPLDSLQDIQINTVRPGEALSIYTNDVYEDSIGSKLSTDWTYRTTQPGCEEAALDFIFPNGLYAHFSWEETKYENVYDNEGNHVDFVEYQVPHVSRGTVTVQFQIQWRVKDTGTWSLVPDTYESFPADSVSVDPGADAFVPVTLNDLSTGESYPIYKPVFYGFYIHKYTGEVSFKQIELFHPEPQFQEIYVRDRRYNPDTGHYENYSETRYEPIQPLTQEEIDRQRFSDFRKSYNTNSYFALGYVIVNYGATSITAGDIVDLRNNDPFRFNTYLENPQLETPATDFKLVPGTGLNVTISAGGFCGPKTDRVISSLSSAIRLSRSVIFPSPGQYDIRVRITNIQYPENLKDPYMSDFFWANLKSIKFDVPPVSVDAPALTMVEMRVKATDQLNGIIDTFSCMARSKDITVYDPDTATWGTGISNKPPDLYRYVHQCEANRKAAATAKIDLDELVDWHELCSDVIRTIDAASAVDKGTYLVGIPVTGHGLSSGTTIYIFGSGTYDGEHTVHGDTTANEIVLSTAYTPEVFSGTEVIVDPNLIKNIDSAGAVDKNVYLVGIQTTNNTLQQGMEFCVTGALNYKDTYTVHSSSTQDEVVFAATYAAETLDGNEKLIRTDSGATIVNVTGVAHEKSTGLVGLSVSSHSWSAGETIYIQGSRYYDGEHVLHADTTTTELVIEYPYTYEDFSLVTARAIETNWSVTTANAADVVDKNSYEVGIPCTNHGLSQGTEIYISGSENYDGKHTIQSVTANEIVISATYVSETFDGTEEILTITSEVNIDNSAIAVDKSTYFVGIPVTDHGLAIGSHIIMSGTDHYDTEHVIHGDTTANEIVINYFYNAETFDGTEKVIIPGFTYNKVIDYQTDINTILAEIAAAGRAAPGAYDNKFSVVQDKLRTAPAQHFTPRNSWGFSSKKVFNKPLHAFRCRFINEQKDFREDERIVYADGYDESNATEFEEIEFPGVTNPMHIYRLARIHLAVIELRPETHTYYSDFEYLACTKGDLVRLSHDVPNWKEKVSSGRIKSITDNGTHITHIEVDEQAQFELAKEYCLRIRHSDLTDTLVNVEFFSDAPELVGDGTFDTGDGWTLTGDSTISSGKLTTLSNATNRGLAQRPIDCEIGKEYQLSIDNDSVISGTWFVVVSEIADPGTLGSEANRAAHIGWNSGTGHYYVDFIAERERYYLKIASSLAEGSSAVWDNASIKLKSSFTNALELSTPAALPSDIAVGDLAIFGERETETLEMIIKNIKPQGDLTAQITVVDAAPAVHTADSMTIPEFNSNVFRIENPAERLGPPVISEIRSGEGELYRAPDGTLLPRIVVSFSWATFGLDASFIKGVILWYRVTGTGDEAFRRSQWNHIKTEDGLTQSVEIKDVIAGETYDIMAQSKTEWHDGERPRYSLTEMCDVIEHTVQGKTSAPDPPVDAVLVPGNLQISVSVAPPNVPDLAAITVWKHTSNYFPGGEPAFTKPVVYGEGNVKAVRFLDTDVATGVETFYWFGTVDVFDNRSETKIGPFSATALPSDWSDDIGGDGKPEDGADVTPGLPMDEYLAAYYTFDDTAVDNSGNGHDGTLNGSASYAAGVSGGCVDIDSSTSDYVEVADHSDFDDIRTWSCWVYLPSEQSHAAQWHILINKHGYSNYGLYLDYLSSPNKISFRVIDSTGTTRQALSSGMEYGKWHHVVGVLGDDLKGRLYINGNLEATTPVAIADNANTGFLTSPIRLGGGVTDRYSTCQVDEVRLYTTPLTPAEIKALYLSPSGNQTARTVVGADYITSGTITGSTLQTAATGKRFVVTHANNEAEFYGDRGDGTVEQLASIGINNDGDGDSTIAIFGSGNSRKIAGHFVGKSVAGESNEIVKIKQLGEGSALYVETSYDLGGTGATIKYTGNNPDSGALFVDSVNGHGAMLQSWNGYALQVAGPINSLGSIFHSPVEIKKTLTMSLGSTDPMIVLNNTDTNGNEWRFYSYTNGHFYIDLETNAKFCIESGALDNGCTLNAGGLKIKSALRIDQTDGAPSFVTYRINTSPQEVQANETITRFNSGGYDNTTYQTQTVWEIVASASDWSATNRGNFIRFFTTADGSTVETARWKITPDGHYVPIADSAYDIGHTNYRVKFIYTDDLVITSTPPSTHNAAGVAGQIQWDGDYLYIHNGTRWGRVSIDFTTTW